MIVISPTFGWLLQSVRVEALDVCPTTGSSVERNQLLCLMRGEKFYLHTRTGDWPVVKRQEASSVIVLVSDAPFAKFADRLEQEKYPIVPLAPLHVCHKLRLVMADMFLRPRIISLAQQPHYRQTYRMFFLR